MKKSMIYTVIGVIVVGVLAVLAYMFVTSPAPSETGSDENASQSSSQSASDNNAPDETVTITYTDNGFEPSTLNLAVGDTLRITNSASSPLQFSSDDHPTHTKNAELNMATLAPGESDDITITKAGDWGIHNHLRPQDTVILIVIE